MKEREYMIKYGIKKILKEALITTVVAVSLIVVGGLLFFLVGLVADTGSVILTILSAIAALFVFGFLFSVSLLFAWRF